MACCQFDRTHSDPSRPGLALEAQTALILFLPPPLARKGRGEWLYTLGVDQGGGDPAG